MRNRLGVKDLWEIVTGEEEAPPNPLITTTTTEVDGQPEVERLSTDNTEAVTKFKKRVKKACVMIEDGLGKAPYILVYKYTGDPKKMWDTLENMYSQRGLTKLSQLLRAVLRKTLGRNEKMMDHISSLRSLFDQVEQCNTARAADLSTTVWANDGAREYIAEEMQCVILLQSVENNPDYSLVVATLETAEDTNLEWEKVSTRLIDAYDKIKGQRRDSGRAHVVQRPPRRDFTCNHCHLRGHKEANCLTNPKSKSFRGSAKKALSKSASKGGANRNRESNRGKKPVAAMARTTRTNRYVMRVGTDITNNESYIIDSGASEHMRYNKTHFISLRSRPSKLITLGDGRSISCEAEGEVDLKMRDKKGDIVSWIRLTNVLFCPDLDMNLISTAALDENNLFISTEKGMCYIYKKTLCKGDDQHHTVGMAALGEDGLHRAIGNIRQESIGKRDSYDTCVNSNEGLEEVAEAVDDKMNHNESSQEDQEKISKEDVDDIKKKYKAKRSQTGQELWHQRLCHVNQEAIKTLSKNKDSGVNFEDEPDSIKCGSCVESKMIRWSQKYPQTPKDATLGSVVFSDLCGPMNVKGHDGSRYVVTFIERTRDGPVYF